MALLETSSAGASLRIKRCAADGTDGDLFLPRALVVEFATSRTTLRAIGVARGCLSVLADLFRVVNGKIIEHWDVVPPSLAARAK
jgi:predicted SnoaL-like aldol condensation-catalyzing enzyme